MQTYEMLKLSACIRILCAGAIEKAKSGHPGMPLGMADVATVLACEFLHFDPLVPRWSNRDRLVLSAGHGSMLLYSMHYLLGYKYLTLEDLCNFRQLHSKTPGHPEYDGETPIECTTGPLGQGVANAVGFAIAAQKRNMHHKIYCIAGDGCLMEGVSYEALALAGHMGLNNIVLLFDDNGITIDGSTDLSTSENQLAKFEAMGWIGENIDGHNYTEIHAALQRANQHNTKPYVIMCKTTIGFGSGRKAGSEESHGAPLGMECIEHLYENIKQYLPQEYSVDDILNLKIPNEYLDIWRQYGMRNNSHNHTSDPQQEKRHFKIPAIDYTKPEATRVSSGRILADLMQSYSNEIITGSADLSISNGFLQIAKNFIHFGIREAAMGAIMNALAIEEFIPICGTFLVFSDYMRPAMRLAAMMHLKCIYVMTHDSIGVGEDGPTHQPVEHLTSLRAIPNMQVIRPCDTIETQAAYDIALNSTKGPTVLSLTRQNVTMLNAMLPDTSNLVMLDAKIRLDMAKCGAYVVCSNTNGNMQHDFVIWASGSEVQLALDVASKIEADFTVCVISTPCLGLFFQQDESYIESLLHIGRKVIAVEAGVRMSWDKILGKDGLFFGVESFGTSAPGKDVYRHFKLTADDIVTEMLSQ